MNRYPVGVKVTVTGTFSNTGVPSDPDSVRAHYRSPSGAQTTLVYGIDPALVRLGIGVYSFEIPLTTDGRWYYRMDDDNENAAAEGELIVSKSRMPDL